MPTYNPTSPQYLTVAQTISNNGQKNIKIILDIDNNDFYTLDDDGNFNPIGGGGNDFTETTVQITAAEIANIGSSPKELLPAPGAGKYYEYYMSIEKPNGWKLALGANEYWYIGNQVDYAGTVVGGLAFNVTFNPQMVTASSDGNFGYINTTDEVSYKLVQNINANIVFSTYTTTNPIAPTTNSSNMLVKIKYKVHTIGL